VTAYALIDGPKLPRLLVADLLEVSAQTIDYHVDQTRARMDVHHDYRAYVETVTEEMTERFRMLGTVRIRTLGAGN